MKKLLTTTLLALAASTALAEYPDKPITIVVPFAAGGPTDKVARDLAEAMRKPLGGATVVIENVGGAGGTLGAAKVARAAPDGYTLLLHHIGMSTSPALYRNLPFKTLDDFEYQNAAIPAAAKGPRSAAVSRASVTTSPTTTESPRPMDARSA